MLRIKSCYIKNFGIVKEEKVIFSSKITAFSGNNGEGKSTFLKSIYMNLFDVYTGKYKDYIRWGEKSFDSVVDFELDDVSALSEFSFKNGRKLTIGQDVYEGSKAKSKLAELLPPKMTMAAAVSKENQIDVVTTTASERREFLKKLYDLNFSEQLGKLEVKHSDFETSVIEVEKNIHAFEMKEYTYTEIPEPTMTPEELSQHKIKGETLSNLIKEYELELKEYDLTLREKEDLCTTLTHLEESKKLQLTSITSQESSIESQEIRIKENEDRIVKLKAQAETNIDIDDILSEDLSLIQADRELIKDFQEKETLKPIRKRSSSLKESILMKITAENSRLVNLEKTKLAMESGICKECGKPYEVKEVSEVEKAITDLSQDIQELKADLHAELLNLRLNEEKIETRIQENDKITKDNNNYSTIEARIKDGEKRYQREKDRLLAEQEKNVQEAFKEITTIEKTLDQLKADVVTTNTNLLDLQKDLQAVELKILEQIKLINDFTIGDPPKELGTGVQQELQELEHLFLKYNNRLTEIETLTRIHEKLTQQKLEDEKILDELRLTRDEYQTELNSIKEAIKLVKTNLPQFILSRLTRSLEGLANHFLASTYEGRYKLTFKPTKNSLELVYGSRETDVKLSSGYEQQLFSTAFKLALSKGIDNKLLILDEVESAASEENSEKLFRFLADTLGTHFEQLIIVTHKPRITQILETELQAKVIYVEKGEIKK